jgi:hypothetical protein
MVPWDVFIGITIITVIIFIIIIIINSSMQESTYTQREQFRITNFHLKQDLY